MWIESLRIDAFGGLRGLALQLGPGLTVIAGPNESGKSTVMAFLRAMLYGLNGRSASLQLNDRKRCAPWDGTPMAGSLRLTDGKTVYEIRRSFGQTKKGDTCRVVEVETGELVPIPTGEEPGDVLLGVDEAAFCDTLFLSWQGSRLAGDGAALGEKIRNLAGTGREDVDLGRLLDRLRDARSAIAPRARDRGTLAETQKELDAARAEKLRAARRGERISQLKQRVDALSAQEKRINGDAARRVQEQRHAAQALAEGQQRERELTARIQALEADHDARRDRWGVVCFALAACMALAGGAAGALRHPLWLLALLPAAGMAGAGVLLRRWRQPAGLDGLRKELDGVRAENAQWGRAAEEAMSALADAHSDDERDRLLEARVELAGLEREQKDSASLDARIAALEAKEARLSRMAAALDIAQEELRAAARERQSDFVPELARGMEEMLERATQGRYAQAAVSRSLELSLQTEQGVQPWGYFSTGTVELMYLALRLSLAQLLRRRCGALPVLLDDPFLCLDDARRARCMEVVRDFARNGQQALLFTCREDGMRSADRVVRMTAIR